MPSKKNDVDQQLIRDLAGILNDTNLTEIEIESDDFRVRVSRQTGSALQSFSIPAAAPCRVKPFHHEPRSKSGKYDAAPMANAQPTIVAMSKVSTRSPSSIETMPTAMAAILNAFSRLSGLA